MLRSEAQWWAPALWKQPGIARPLPLQVRQVKHLAGLVWTRPSQRRAVSSRAPAISAIRRCHRLQEQAHRPLFCSADSGYNSPRHETQQTIRRDRHYSRRHPGGHAARHESARRAEQDRRAGDPCVRRRRSAVRALDGRAARTRAGRRQPGRDAAQRRPDLSVDAARRSAARRRRSPSRPTSTGPATIGKAVRRRALRARAQRRARCT